jgi:glutamate synthase (NADPH/NADH) small chain
VLGGGDTGSDCIGTSHRQDAKHVYNFELLEKPPATRTQDTPWPLHPMPSQILRTSSSHEEGGDRDWGISTIGFSGSGGRVERLHAVRVQLEAPDANGQRALRPVPSSEFTIDADLVLLALGFVGPVREGLIGDLALELDRRGNVATSGYATSLPGVFAVGDMRRGQSLVVWAIAEGREAAVAAHEYLKRAQSVTASR